VSSKTISLSITKGYRSIEVVLNDWSLCMNTLCFIHDFHFSQIRNFRPLTQPNPTDKAFHWRFSIAATGPLVHSRLDYCNGLLANCGVAVRYRMQRIQDSAARLVSQNQLVVTLHHCCTAYIGFRFPNTWSTNYAFWCSTFSTERRPAAQVGHLCSRCNDHRLRSSVRGDFTVRRTRTNFAVAGPAAWNSLPTSMRNIHTHAAFCRHLKTYLFSSPGWLT